MEDKYSTIQQHQPLRIPSSFDKQGRALIVQLDEIFDDIYKRFGRLRVEDLGQALRKKLSDYDGNFSEIDQEIDKIFLVVQNRDGDMSGIELTAGGLDMTGSKHVKLQSGNTYILLEPTKIDMNSAGLVNIIGKDNSVIKLIGGTGNEQTLFQADSSGVIQAVNILSSLIQAADIEVTNLKVNGNMQGVNVPNIVISETQPASGNKTIWLEPNNSVIEPFTRTQSVADAQASGWGSGNVSWSQTVSLASAIAVYGAAKIKFSGNLYKNGTDTAYSTSLSAVANLSNGETVSLGTVGTFAGRQSFLWNYGFSKEQSCDLSAASYENVTLTSITLTYAVNGNDQYGKRSSCNSMSITVSGQTGTGSSDECTVHYIP